MSRSAHRATAARLASFGARLVWLTGLLAMVWVASSILLPEELLRPYFRGILDARGFEPTTWGVFIGNVLPFVGVVGLNVFRVDGRPGGIYVLIPFWVVYGLLLGTGSFVLVPGRVALSPAVLWEHSGYTELIAYSLAFEASRGWAIWSQRGLFGAPRRLAVRVAPTVEDLTYLAGGFAALALAAVREMS